MSFLVDISMKEAFAATLIGRWYFFSIGWLF